jgi:hypothetical protein
MMRLINKNANANSVEIALTRDELILILRAFSNIQIGLQTKEYLIMLNVDYVHLDHLIGKFNELWNEFNQDESLQKSDPLVFKCFDATRDILTIEINKLAFKAIYGALSHVSVWVYEEDCPSMISVSWLDILNVKRDLLILRRINEK